MDLHPPSINKKSAKLVSKAVLSGWLSSSGKYVKIFENKIRNFISTKYSVATINGTSAIHLSLLASGLKKNEEVLVPSISFVATINPIIYCNAIPVFMDCDSDFNLDVKKTIDFLNNETYSHKKFTFNKKSKRKISTIIVVHAFGNPCNIKELVKIAKKKNVRVIEDAAESLGSYFKYNNKIKHTGSLGLAGCISFNVNKIITTGSGGMLVTNSKSIYLKAKHLSNQAKKDPIFFKHDKIGFNYAMPNMNAALGLSQFVNLKNSLYKKKKIFNLYKSLFSGISIIKVMENSFGFSNNWLVVIKINSKNNLLPKMVKYLRGKKIEVRPVWHLLYKQDKYKKYQRYLIKNSPIIVKNSLCLPSGVNLNHSEIKKICKELKNFLKTNNCLK